MQRVAFKMTLFKGYEAEYKKRHDEIWNDLKKLLKDAGIADYSIFLDEETNSLFAYLIIQDKKNLDALSQEPVMKKWWAYMKDVMATNEDNSPLIVELKEVFYLP
jgi:L-rhamnose mutarotase